MVRQYQIVKLESLEFKNCKTLGDCKLEFHPRMNIFYGFAQAMPEIEDYIKISNSIFEGFQMDDSENFQHIYPCDVYDKEQKVTMTTTVRYAGRKYHWQQWAQMKTDKSDYPLVAGEDYGEETEELKKLFRYKDIDMLLYIASDHLGGRWAYSPRQHRRMFNDQCNNNLEQCFLFTNNPIYLHQACNAVGAAWNNCKIFRVKALQPGGEMPWYEVKEDFVDFESKDYEEIEKEYINPLTDK